MEVTTNPTRRYSNNKHPFPNKPISSVQAILDIPTNSKKQFLQTDVFQQKAVLFEVFECIKRCSEFGGKVFGGFVRDIVVPHLRKSKEAVVFKDVDVWFKTNKDADAFYLSMQSVCRAESTLIKVKGKGRASLGQFSRQFCILAKYGVVLSYFDIIVADKLPVNDFDVNTVTYSLTKEGEWVTDSPQYLVDKINLKQATMLAPYSEKIDLARNNKEFGHASLIYYETRINRIFIYKGWKVFIPALMESNYFVIKS